MRRALRLGTVLVVTLVVPVALTSSLGCEKRSSSSGRAEPAQPPGVPSEGPEASSSGGQAPHPSAQPVETHAPNGADQKPAFPGQTRAPADPKKVAFDVRVVASGLATPWAVAFLPDGSKLVTERPGRMRIIGADGNVSAPLAGVPEVDARGQGGLLDVTLGPTFAQDSLVYFSYAEPRQGGNGTAVARARLARSASPRLEDVHVIWRMTPTLESTMHFGSRLVFARDGNLFVTLGERSILAGRKQAQDLGSAFGKIVRIRPDGSVPPDNPFVGQKGALPEIWSLGHRNVQAALIHPRTGELWEVEHGARGGDEINIVRAGKNYGWPTISYGIEYDGTPIGQGITAKAGLEQPIYYWDPSIAPCGAAYYDADAFPAWKGSLFVGALAGKHLARLTLDGERVVGEERLLVDRGRIRDVRVGPSGTLFVSDESSGEILELVPR